MRRILVLACVFVLAPTTVAGARGLRAPALAAPSDGASSQQLPALQWGAVSGAAEYEYQIAADTHFNSIALGTGLGKGTGRTHNLAAALDKAVPDGTYYWRVRAVSSTDRVGPWSRVRRVHKAWTSQPQIIGGDGAAVSWPTAPLVLEWTAASYATKYVVSVATDEALSNLVVGSVSQPVETQSTSYALPASLAPGAYYWAVTPVDARGHRGHRSRVAAFQWTWPTSTSTALTDLNPDARVFDPMFSWTPVPGAARYEVEVNSAQEFPAGSRWCCTGTTTGTSLAPLQVLPNNSYYWRVRAIDARGNAGTWNYGEPFTKAFDSLTPSIPDLTMRDVHGTALAGAPATPTPIVTWDPVPGASLYEVQLGNYVGSGGYCDWSITHEAGYHAQTATTAWTPLATTAYKPYQEGWPAPEEDRMLATGPDRSYCVRVLARTDNDAQGRQVTSDWTYLNGYNSPAFTFATPPAGSLCRVMPSAAYDMPVNGLTTVRTPYFTWEAIPGAGSYYVMIARDAGFTQVVDVGFTDIPAYAPRLSNGAPLSDETTSYYWAVMPAVTAGGHEVCSEPLLDSPQSFNKNSTAPSPLSPASGEAVIGQPTFRWSAAENARSYRLQVSQDPTFGNPIDNVTTDATAFTSSSTYPADTVIYWRVRANDWNGQGLNWSPVRTFVRRLPVPSLSPRNATSGVSVPPFAWSPVPGAIAYDVHVEEPDGKLKDSRIETPSFSVGKYYGSGIWRWQVRAEFPTALTGTVAGAYSPLSPFLLSLAPPSGARGVRAGSRLLVSWNPEPDAREYDVEVSSTTGFNSRLEAHHLDGTTWAPSINPIGRTHLSTLYWRVAAVDWGGNIGPFSSGAFTSPTKPTCGRRAGPGKHPRPCPSHRHRDTPKHTVKRHG